MSNLNNPSIEEFFAASKPAQSDFIDKILPTEKLYEEAGDTILGMYYEGARDRDSEWINYPEDYDVVSILEESGEIDSDRLSAIENGSPIAENELQILRRDHADNDPDGWDGVHLWAVELKDGPLFVAFQSQSQGQAGFTMDYSRSFRSKEDAIAWLKTFEINS